MSHLLALPSAALLAWALTACQGDTVGSALSEAGGSDAGSAGSPPEQGGKAAAQLGGQAGDGSAPAGSVNAGEGGKTWASTGFAGFVGPSGPTGAVSSGGGSADSEVEDGSGGRATGGSDLPPSGGIGGASPAGGTGGGSLAGGTGGASATGGTGGSNTGGAGGVRPSGGAGGSLPCSEGQTRYDCSDGRQVCVAGVWQGDRRCYADACDLVDCGGGSSECCEGWGQVGVEGYSWADSDEIVTSFGLVETPGRYLEATFSFTTAQDIGAITLFLTEPVPWETIRQIDVVMTYDGNPVPVVEVSLENSAAKLGGIWYPEEVSSGLFRTPSDMYGEDLYCFLAGCPEDAVDLINIRLRPLDLQTASGVAELQVYSIAIGGL